MKNIFLFLIKIYQLFIPPILMQIFGARCRYGVTCSEYAKQQIEKEGVIRGSLRALKRIVSCQPFSKKYNYV